MKKTLSLTILFLITSVCSSFAQTDNSERQYLSDSSRALQFQIGSNFTLNSFQGSTISYKYHLKSNSALRAGLSLELSTNDGEDNTDDFNSDTVTGAFIRNSKYQYYYIEIKLQYIYYMNPGSKILLYTGAGPLFGYNKATNNSVAEYNYTGNQTSKMEQDQKRSSTSAGISGLLGVEWFVSSGISLSAEYDLSIGYLWSKIEEMRIEYTKLKSVSKGSSSGWRIYDNSVKFGLTVYFM